MIRLPSEADLDNYVGWNPDLTDAMKEMEESQKEDRVKIQQHLDKMEETLTGIVKKLRAMQISQELRDEKENKVHAIFKKWKINNDPKTDRS